MTRALACLALALSSCSTDLVAPEDPRCTIHISEGEAVDISRWQIEHCESVRVIVVHFDGTVP